MHTTVIVDQTKARRFDAIKNDVSFTEVKQKEKKEKAAVAARLKGTQVRRVRGPRRHLQRRRRPGTAQETLNWLQNNEGVTKSSNGGQRPAALSKTTLEYAPDQADQARKLADIMGLSGSAMKPGKSETNSQGLPAMMLTLGKDFKGAGVTSTRGGEGAGRGEVHGGQDGVREVRLAPRAQRPAGWNVRRADGPVVRRRAGRGWEMAAVCRGGAEVQAGELGWDTHVRGGRRAPVAGRQPDRRRRQDRAAGTARADGGGGGRGQRGRRADANTPLVGDGAGGPDTRHAAGPAISTTEHLNGNIKKDDLNIGDAKDRAASRSRTRRARPR